MEEIVYSSIRGLEEQKKCVLGVDVMEGAIGINGRFGLIYTIVN